MSVYGGFGTRQQESTYSKALYNTLFLLQLRIFKLFKGEKFDDIKFGKVLTKLYARLFTMEQVKYLPPKYSFAMKDLAEYLGIFEITEDQIKSQKGGSDYSETSSNLSYMTQSAFKPKNSHLDVIREHNTHKEEEEDTEEEDGGGGRAGKRAKQGRDRLLNKLAQNAQLAGPAQTHGLAAGANAKAGVSTSNNTTMTSSILHNTGSSILGQGGATSDEYQTQSNASQSYFQSKIKLQKSQINYGTQQSQANSGQHSSTNARSSVARSLPPNPSGVSNSTEFQTPLYSNITASQNGPNDSFPKMARKPSQQSDRMSVASGRGAFQDAGQRMINRGVINNRGDDFEAPVQQMSHPSRSHRGEDPHMLLEMHQQTISGTTRHAQQAKQFLKQTSRGSSSVKNGVDRQSSYISQQRQSNNGSGMKEHSSTSRKKSLKKKRLPQMGYETQLMGEDGLNEEELERQYSNQNEDGAAQDGTEESGGEERSLEAVNVDDTNFKVQSANLTPANRGGNNPMRRNIGPQMQYSDEQEGEGGEQYQADNSDMMYNQQRKHYPQHYMHQPSAPPGMVPAQQSYQNMAAIYNSRPGGGGSKGQSMVREGGKSKSQKRMKNELQNHQNSLMQQYMLSNGNGGPIPYPQQQFASKFVAPPSGVMNNPQSIGLGGGYTVYQSTGSASLQASSSLKKNYGR